MDPRYLTLARNLVSHSTKIERGENVLVHSFDIPEEMSIALIRAIKEKGGYPYSLIQAARVDRECVLGASKKQLEKSIDSMKGIYYKPQLSRNTKKMAETYR